MHHNAQRSRNTSRLRARAKVARAKEARAKAKTRAKESQVREAKVGGPTRAVDSKEKVTVMTTLQASTTLAA